MPRSTKSKSTNPQLDAVLAHPDNQCCADCGTRGPRWASVNIGVLLCTECGGVHRGMGVHISSVKSVSLDEWHPQWIETVSKVGNRIGNYYYENRLPKSFDRSKQTESREKIVDWIRKKYELKDYVPRGKLSPAELVAKGCNPDVCCDSEGSRPSSNDHMPKSGSGDGQEISTGGRGNAAQLNDSQMQQNTDAQAQSAEIHATVGPSYQSLDLLTFDSLVDPDPDTGTGPQPVAQSWAQFEPQLSVLGQGPEASQAFDGSMPGGWAKFPPICQESTQDKDMFQGFDVVLPDLRRINEQQQQKKVKEEKVEHLKSTIAALYDTKPQFQDPGVTRYAASGPMTGMMARMGQQLQRMPQPDLLPAPSVVTCEPVSAFQQGPHHAAFADLIALSVLQAGTTSSPLTDRRSQQNVC